MASQNEDDRAKVEWIEPEIRELDLMATSAFPGRGADVGGNSFLDCQFS